MPELPNPQYHHFVPQFLLRNFSHKYKPPQEPPGSPKPRKKKYAKGMFPGDPVIRHVDLTADPYVICEKPVRRVLGRPDMYRDTSRPTPQQQHIEQMLSGLESRASAVFLKITKAYKEHRAGVCLTRGERDVIRKFLFILKYRGETFSSRFSHESTETYDANDRATLLDYMREMGFERPIDVWFDNIKTIIELDMDLEQKWITELPEKIFPPDARWFCSHAQGSYMTICTPEDAASEFVLTSNSYNIFEGPNNMVFDETTGTLQAGLHASLHEFAPVSPKLMIVLRSQLFPVPEEDQDEEIRKAREKQMHELVHKIRVSDKISLLEHLPVTKARNNYTEIKNGRIYINVGEDGSKRRDHKFFFNFFPINNHYVNVINGVFMDNAVPHCTSVVFESEMAFRQTLQWFLAAPTESAGKIVPLEPDDRRLGGLRKLEALGRSLGLGQKLVYEAIPFPLVTDYSRECGEKLQGQILLDHVLRKGFEALDGNKTREFYETLGGDESTVGYDMDYSLRMWKVWCLEMEHKDRERIEMLLTEAYIRFSTPRFWLFVKRMRHGYLSRVSLSIHAIRDMGSLLTSQPEDKIARAIHIVRPTDLNRLLYQTAFNDVEIKTQLKIKLNSEYFSHHLLCLPPDEAETQGRLLYKIVFVNPGSILQCGIREVEELATEAARAVCRNGLWKHKFPYPFNTANVREKIELATRVVVKSKFAEALREQLEPDLLEELHQALFEVTYPTFELDRRHPLDPFSILARIFGPDIFDGIDSFWGPYL